MECCDVFSGVAGLSLALRGIVKTLIYCDFEKYCQQVLSARMNDGSIDKAPIHGDIKTLHLGDGLKPVILIGGFPCSDISTAGQQKGIIVGGDRSSLFYEVMRIVDETPSINYIFLENVSNIVKIGMKEVIEEIVIKREWTMQWTMKSAAMLGAPHQRKRWFCLAVRPGATVAPIIDDEPIENHWAIEHAPRVSFKPRTLPDNASDPTYDPHWIARCQALGNSVVPCVVRAAFLELWNASADVPTIVKSLYAYCQEVSELDYPYPESGIIFKGKFLGLEGKRTRTTTSISVCVNGSNMSALPTPRRGITHASTVTDRSLHDLPTVLLNSTVAMDYIRERLGVVPEKLMSVCIPNVNYIEWMMGYRADWTRIPVDTSVPASASTSKGIKNKREEFADVDADDGATCAKDDVACAPKRSRINGMHIFMRENPGKDVRTIAAMWRGLTDELRANYTRLAKQEH